MIKISGLDQWARQLQQAQEAFGDMDGELGTVQFDPGDPASIEAAIVHMESLVDERAGRWPDNPFVRQLADGAKEHFREAILDRAAHARAKGSNE